MSFTQHNPAPSLGDPTPAARSNPAVDLTDINNARTIGVILVPSGSRVLDIGAARGAVAETLRNRGCRVWGVEVDRDAAAAAAQFCEQMVAGDVEAIDLTAEFPGMLFDTVLLLDVLEHLRCPADVLRKAVGALAPGGRVIASIPNVTHASVRLQLLAGRFVRTETGLLDRTHLQFFDRPAIQQLFDAAGLSVIDEFTVVRRIDQTEIDLDVSAFSPEVLLAATGDAESEVYQFIISAGSADDPNRGHDPLSAGSFLRRVRTLEGEYHRLESWATSLERQVLQTQSSYDAAAAEIKQLTLQLERQSATISEERAAFQLEMERQSATISAERAVLQLEMERQSATISEERAVLQLEMERQSATISEERAAFQLEIDRHTSAAAEARGLEDEYHRLESWATSLERQVLQTQSSYDAAAAEIKQLTLQLERQSATISEERAALQLEIDRHASAAAEERGHQERLVKLLGQDVAVRDEYLVHLRHQAKESEAAMVTCARGIQTLERDLADLRETTAKTLALPRYRLADRMNRRLLAFRPIHQQLRRWVVALLSWRD